MRTLLRGVAAALTASALVLAGAGLARADNVVASGDIVRVAGVDTLEYGTVCVGRSYTKSASVAIKKNGKYGTAQVYMLNSSATVTATDTLAALVTSFPAGNVISIPSNWNDAGQNQETGSVLGQVTLAPTTPGAISGSIAFTATGIQSDGTTLIRSVNVAVTATAISCNTPPTISVNDVTLEGNTLGGRKLVFSEVGSASDAEDGTLDVSCSPAIGTLLALGPRTVTCTATDSQGATATDSGTVTIVDTKKPTILDTPSSLTLEATGPSGATVTYASPTATDIVWGGVSVTCAPASTSTFPLGSTTVTCTATDGSGNTATTSFAVNVQDTTKPVFIQPADLTVEATSGAGSTVTYSAPVATDAVSGSITGNCSPASGSTFALGDTTVTCTATDGAGNSGTTSFVVHVVDTTAPELTVPADIVAEATSASGAVVTFTATATDAVDPSPSVSCSPASGDTFPIGETLVTCTATDAAGNVSAAKTFTVTVQDTTPPTLVGMPANMVVEGNTLGGANTGFTMPTATDLVDPAPVVTCDHPESDFYPLGETTVSCHATDAAGNTSEPQTFTITVQDTTAPEITFVSQEPAANSYGWNNTDVVVTWSCSDIVWATWSTTTTVSTEGADQSATGTCTDGSNNSASDTVTGVSIDKTAPALNITGPANGATVDVCTSGAITRPSFAPSDALSGLATSSDSWTQPSTASGVGTYTYAASATDKADNQTTETRTYKVVYGSGAWVGFLQPINNDGSSRFKLGSTVPVKFQLLCNGVPIPTAIAKLYVKKADGTPDAGIDEAISTSAATTGNLFRYSDPQYIFNLSTKAGYTNPGSSTPISFTTGTWTITAVLDDGSVHSVNIQLVR